MGELRLGNKIFVCRSFRVHGRDIQFNNQTIRLSQAFGSIVQIRGKDLVVARVSIPGIMFLSGEVVFVYSSVLYAVNAEAVNVASRSTRLMSESRYAAEYREQVEKLSRRSFCMRKIVHISGEFDQIVVDGLDNSLVEAQLSGRFCEVQGNCVYFSGKAKNMHGNVLYTRCREGSMFCV